MGKLPQRRGGSAPRCRLGVSWGCRRSQGSVCSPVKTPRELGSERRKTARSLSGATVDSCGSLFLVREDRKGRIPGEPVVRLSSLHRWEAISVRDKR